MNRAEKWNHARLSRLVMMVQQHGVSRINMLHHVPIQSRVDNNLVTTLLHLTTHTPVTRVMLASDWSLPLTYWLLSLSLVDIAKYFDAGRLDSEV